MIWSQIDRDIRTYLGVKTLMSLMVAMGGYVVLRVVGVQAGLAIEGPARTVFRGDIELPA